MNNHHSARRAALLCSLIFSCSALLLVIALPAADDEPVPSKVEAAVKAAGDTYKNLKEGKIADYIPALAKVDPNIVGIALVTADGKVYTYGDMKSDVSIQSISKVFTTAKVMEEQGPDAIRKRIGVDAAGTCTPAAAAAD